MKTTITLLTALAVLTTFSSFAQTSDEETEAIVTLLGVQKKEVIAKLVPVTGKDSAAFWKLYNEYSQLNKANAKDRIKLYERTAQSYTNMNAAIADSLANQYFVNRIDQEKALETYYKKIKTATNAVIAFEFYQAEVYILTQVRATIMQQIPMYGEVVSASKK